MVPQDVSQHKDVFDNQAISNQSRFNQLDRSHHQGQDKRQSTKKQNDQSNITQLFISYPYHLQQALNVFLFILLWFLFMFLLFPPF